MGSYSFRADRFVVYKLEEICGLSGEDPRSLIEESIKEAHLEFERRSKSSNGYTEKGWGFRDYAIRTNDVSLLSGPSGKAVLGRFQKIAFDVAINRYIWQKVIERRQRLLRQP
jgi:hypothetical protein